MKISSLTALALIATATAITATTNTATASEFQLGLSDHTAEMIYSSHMNEQAIGEASWLYDEDDGSLVGLGFYGVGQRDAISGKLGGKLFYTDVDGPSGHGLAVGGTITFHASENLSVALDLHYAPSVLSFKDVEHLEQWGGRIAYQLMDTANLFIGYRNVEVDIKKVGDIELTKGGYAGLSITF